jgi:hypothetical protein
MIKRNKPLDVRMFGMQAVGLSIDSEIPHYDVNMGGMTGKTTKHRLCGPRETNMTLSLMSDSADNYNLIHNAIGMELVGLGDGKMAFRQLHLLELRRGARDLPVHQASGHRRAYDESERQCALRGAGDSGARGAGNSGASWRVSGRAHSEVCAMRYRGYDTVLSMRVVWPCGRER